MHRLAHFLSLSIKNIGALFLGKTMILAHNTNMPFGTPQINSKYIKVSIVAYCIVGSLGWKKLDVLEYQEKPL